MKKILTYVFLFVGLISGTFGSDLTTHYDSLYRLGNKTYKAQQFDSALVFYSTILNSGFESADLYYNLGNANYKLNKIPEAILYFEKSLKLDPNSLDAKYNLELANKLIVDKIESLPVPFYSEWKNGLLTAFHYDIWGYLSIGFITASMFFLLVYLMTKTLIIRKISFYLFIVFILGTGITYYFAKSQMNTLTHSESAIVFANRTNVYAEPNTNGSTLFVIHSGLKVKILSIESKWCNIVLPDGSVGWIPEEVLSLI